MLYVYTLLVYIYTYMYTRLDLSIAIDRQVEQLRNDQQRTGSSVPVTHRNFGATSQRLTRVTNFMTHPVFSLMNSSKKKHKCRATPGWLNDCIQ